MTAAQKCELLSNMMQYVTHKSRLFPDKFIYKEAALIGESELDALIEKEILEKSAKTNGEGVGVFVNKQENITFLINSDTHFKIKTTVNGFDFKAAYNIASMYDDFICGELPLAFSEKYGYLFQDILKCGTGFEVSALLHLPSLEYTEGLKRYAENMKVFGILIEECDCGGSLYKIKNVLTSGISEEEGIANLIKVTEMLSREELNLRESLKDDVYILRDMLDAAEMLKNVMTLSFSEMLIAFSLIRVGVSLGLITGIDTQELNKYMKILGDASIKEAYPFDEVEKRRAKLVKSLFSKVYY